MKLLGCLLLFVVIAISQCRSIDIWHLKKPHYDIKDAPALFKKFVKDFKRHYKDEADKEVHYVAFVENLKEIIQANAESPNTVFDINKFADYTSEEEKYLHGLKWPVTTEREYPNIN